ncbi:hypothetical protein CDL12_20075 [Handroanthus impetiginosus]|uniref:Uncharacterized protein n=1 Tax=Handroanthus impetiginosus TaxID=429701 RepID=A0A2G9GPY9_9LAMI|nr:hypothetical protein CDL12_20075 [Handroanthus impetiginosus]
MFLIPTNTNQDLSNPYQDSTEQKEYVNHRSKDKEKYAKEKYAKKKESISITDAHAFPEDHRITGEISHMFLTRPTQILEI